MQTVRSSRAHDYTPAPDIERASTPIKRRLRFVIVQETAGVWIVRGLEHDVVVEGRSIGTAVRSAISFIEAHNAFDVRHDLRPLSAFPPAPPVYWQAYGAGTPLSLTQLGITPPDDWEICAAVAHRRP
ncbi:MAG TPA: hypothetical protein VGJ39_14110 [Vicinamibacterales bacterium]